MPVLLSQRPKIGILGGGQLGAMLIRHAIDFGFDISVLDADADAPCARFVRNFHQASPLDGAAVEAFAQGLDVLTVEMEAVNTEALEAVRARGVSVFPSPELLRIIQDKGLQKKFLQDHGYPVAKGQLVDNRASLKDAAISYPSVLKMRRGGYDGQGVMMLRSEEDLESAFDAPSLLEEVVNIDIEISVIVARNTKGETAVYDPVQMVFHLERFVLQYQLCPATGISPALAEDARKMAGKLAQDIDLVGLLAVELFVTKDGRLVVNELAPRPHNSGHHSIEGCVTSQFEQHLRVITGMTPGSTEITQPTVMINYLDPGADAAAENDSALQAVLETPGAHLHWYGKTTGRKGRKTGHITVTSETIESAIEKAEALRARLPQF